MAADPFIAAKVRWLDAVARDRRATHFDFRVAYILSGYFNRGTGDAWPSQSTIAKEIGSTPDRNGVRGVQKSLAHLVELGHLNVEVGTGRGHTNRYSPAEKSTNEGSCFTEESTNTGSPIAGGNDEPAFAVSGEKGRTELPERTNRITGKDEQPFVQNLLKNPLKNLKAAARGNLDSKKEAGGYNLHHESPEADGWRRYWSAMKIPEPAWSTRTGFYLKPVPSKHPPGLATVAA